MILILKHCLTGRDNATYDVGRVLWALGVVAYIVYQGYAVLTAHEFHAQDYGIGLGSVLAGGGAGLRFKETTEPGAAQPDGKQTPGTDAPGA